VFNDTEVNPRISERHPELTEADVCSAWCNAVVIVERRGAPLPDAMLVALGFDSNDRLVEVVDSVMESGRVHVFHAMTPPLKRTLMEIRNCR